MAERILYIDETDLLAYKKKVDLDNLKIVIDEESGLTNVHQAIIDNCNYADSMLANKYQVPFEEGSSYIDKIKAPICHLVLFDLLTNLEGVSEQEVKLREIKHKDAIDFFKSIRDGKTDLITELNEDNEKTDRYFFDSWQRIDRDFH